MSATSRRDWLALAGQGDGLVLLEHRPVTNLLVMELINVETNHLSLLRDTETHAWGVLEDEEKDSRDGERVRGDGADIGELLADLDTLTVEATRGEGGTIEGGDPLLGEDAGEEAADDTADTVELEDIHALINTEPDIEVLDGGADDAGEEANESGDPEGDVAGGWGDADETGDSTAACTDGAELALVADHVDEDPAENTERGGGVGVEGSDHGTHRGVESRATLGYR